MLTTRVDLDISKPLYNKITAKQGDIASRFLEFHLHANGVPFSLENKNVRFHMLKPDGTEIFNDVPKGSDVGVCTLELTSQCLIEPGIGKAELVIYMNGKKLSTIPFKIEIIESVNSEAAELSSNEFSALDEALAKIDKIEILDNISGKVNEFNETLAKIGDLDEVVTKIDNLDDELNRVGALEPQVASWVDYKNNGGNVGGNVKFNNNIEITDNIIQSNLSELALNDNNNYGYATVILKNKGQGIGEFTAREGQNIDLGSPSIGFQNVYIQGLSKSQPGYTKLPNGFIMQWGILNVDINPPNSFSFDVILPIAFPTETLYCSGNVKYNFTKDNDHYIEHINVSIQTLGSDRLRIKARDVGVLDTASRFQVHWFAIGY